MDLSRVPVAEIRRVDHFKFDEIVRPQHMELEHEDIFFNQDLRVEGEIQNFDEEMLVNADIRGGWQAQCSRCLENFNQGCNQHFEFAIDEKLQKNLDLIKYFREELVLNFPMIFLCSKNCKGLCVECGQNLNKLNCMCSQKKGNKNA